MHRHLCWGISYYFFASLYNNTIIACVCCYCCCKKAIFVVNFSCLQGELLFTELKLLFWLFPWNSVTSAPPLCCLFAFLSQSSLAFLLVSPSLSNAWERISSVFFCDLFLRSCCYNILSLILLVSRPEISSNSTPSSVGLGDAPLTFAFSLLCCRNLQSSKSNLSFTVHWFTLNLATVTLLRFSELCVQILPLSLLPFLNL